MIVVRYDDVSVWFCCTRLSDSLTVVKQAVGVVVVVVLVRLVLVLVVVGVGVERWELLLVGDR